MATSTRNEIKTNRVTNRVLTPHQQWVALYLATGMTCREVATALSISVNTVNTHRRMIYTKTGSRNRVDLHVWAVQHGLITN